MRLHLGCGHDKKEGYLNCDISEHVRPDKVVDLERELPFESDSVEEIVANHVLEHVNNFVPLIHEFWRVCRAGAVIKLKVPFYASITQYNDPTHVRVFTPFSFDYFREGPYSHEVGSKGNMFDIAKVFINYGLGRTRRLNFIMNPVINLSHRVYCHFFAWLLPASEIHFELKVLK